MSPTKTKTHWMPMKKRMEALLRLYAGSATSGKLVEVRSSAREVREAVRVVAVKEAEAPTPRQPYALGDGEAQAMLPRAWRPRRAAGVVVRRSPSRVAPRTGAPDASAPCVVPDGSATRGRRARGSGSRHHAVR